MKPIVLLLFIISLSSHAQKTVSLSKNVISPNAEITDIDWMEGHWKDEAFGGVTEEIWSPPLGGSMMFSFKLVVDGEIGVLRIRTYPTGGKNLGLRTQTL